MELYLDNIGKICDSTIIVDGLTIITGGNNSGKTTVGKTLYSITSAVENLQQNALLDRLEFAKKEVYRILRRLELSDWIFEEEVNDNIDDIDSIFDLTPFKQIDSIESILSVIDEKIKKLNSYSEKDIYEYLKKQEKKNPIAERATDHFMKKREEVITSLVEVKKNVQTDIELVGYANANIVKTLNHEFYNQIKGIYNESKESEIRLFHEGEEYCNIKLQDNELSGKDKSSFSLAFDLSLFIDDVFVVDKMINRRTRVGPIFYNKRIPTFLDTVRIMSHKEKLIDKLVSDKNIFEENLYKAKTEEIIKCMKEANPGQMNFVKGKYVIGELDIRNLAMGSKMFLIIKLLIEKGYCDSKTLLVLDEPETHLHPEWQSILAEIIVLLTKLFETKVILTTHNPSFLLAIDYFSTKHKIRDITHFYESIDEEKKVTLKNVDKNINVIYAKMTKPFVELEAKIDYASDENND